MSARIQTAEQLLNTKITFICQDTSANDILWPQRISGPAEVRPGDPETKDGRRKGVLDLLLSLRT